MIAVRLPDIKVVLRIMSYLVLIEAGFLLISGGISIIYGEKDYVAFLISAAITIVLPIAVLLLTPKNIKNMGKREGYLVVALTWIVFTLFGMLPFLFSGATDSVTDAFFETMSGFTSTGATVFSDVESLSHGILFWRALTQWIGGLGIITFFLAILPMLGVDAMGLFAAEVPGVSKTKLHARVGQTAKFFWAIYIGFTAAETLSLWIAGMEVFDAVCHSFATMSCGGFSTKNLSLAYWQSPAMEYIVTLFMTFGGINFALYYFLIKGSIGKFFKNEELRYYLAFIGFFTILIAVVLLLTDGQSGVEQSFRCALFNVVSIMTTTGFTNADYMQWHHLTWTALILLMCFGGMSGSTAGGIKTSRIAMILKNGYYEFKRLAHPNAIIPVRFEGRVVDMKVMQRVYAFVMMFIAITAAAVLALTAFGMDFVEAVSSGFNAISNVGVGMGGVGPEYNFTGVSAASKWVMSLLMLIGRLELFTVLIVFTPAFWKQ